jgi:hypothetical protein
MQPYGDQDIFLLKYKNCSGVKADISGRLSYCQGSYTELSVRGDFSNITWNDTIEGNNSIRVNKRGQYHVRIMDRDGCLFSDTVLVIESNLPVFTLGRDTSVIVNDSLILKAPEDQLIYQWNDNSRDPEYIARAVNGKPGISDFWLKVTDSLGCTFSDTISVTFLHHPVTSTVGLKQVIIYPNPVKERIFWYMKTEKIYHIVAELSDMKGRILIHQDVKGYQSGELREIALDHIAPGIYNIRIINSSSGERYATARIIKQ